MGASFFDSIKKTLLSKTFGLVSLMALILAIPFTVFISQQQQDIRQSAHSKKGKGPTISFGEVEKLVTNTRTLSPKLTLNEELIVECAFDKLVTKQVNDKLLRIICAQRPLGTLVGISEEQTVLGKLFVGFAPNNSESVDKVEFYIDDTLINTELNQPFVLGGKDPLGKAEKLSKKKLETVLEEISLGYDTAELADGVHTLKVVAYSAGNDETGTIEVTFTSENSASPTPTPTGGASVTPTPTPTSEPSPTGVPTPTNYLNN